MKKVFVIVLAIMLFNCDLVGFYTVNNNTGETVKLYDTYMSDGGTVWVTEDKLEDIQERFEVTITDKYISLDEIIQPEVTLVTITFTHGGF